MIRKVFLSAIVILAFFLRVVSLKDFPTGFTADEAAQGYTAYSILKTGRDEWGVQLPLTPRSFGDFKAPLYTYLVIPSITIFGLNEFAVRLPNAILGTLAVLVVYLLFKELFSHESMRMLSRLPAEALRFRGAKVGINANSQALIASFLLAISPWHISLSRGAFEANLTTFFLPLAVLFFLRGLHNSRQRGGQALFIILSSFFFGLNLFTYHSARLVTPLLLVFLIFCCRKRLTEKVIYKHKFICVTSAIIFLFFVFLGGLSFIGGGGTRVSDIGVFSGGWQAVSEQRFFANSMGLPDFISRIFNNKLSFVWGEFIKNYFSYLSPQFLFTQGAGEATYGMTPGRGVLYFMELPFLLTAFYFLFKEKLDLVIFLWFWVLISSIPAALSRGVGYHANRVAVMMPAIQILSAYGALTLIDLVRKRFPKFLKLFLLFYSSTLLLSFIFFLEDYFFQAPKINAPKMSYGWREAMNYLKDQDKEIIISRSFSEPQAFVMFYGKLDPKKVQSETQSWLRYEKEGHFFVDQMGNYTLANYEFRNFSFPEDWQKREVVLVGTEKDFLGQEKMLQEKIIGYPDGKVAIKIIEIK